MYITNRETITLTLELVIDKKIHWVFHVIGCAIKFSLF